MSGTKKCLEGWREILIIFGLPFNFMFLYRFNLEDLLHLFYRYHFVS